MSITAPDDRLSTYNPVVPTTEFPAGFPIFSNEDIRVFHDNTERFDFSVVATYAEGMSNNAKVVFATGITGVVQIVGERDPRRSNYFTPGAPIPPRDLNQAFNSVEAEVQEARRDLRRAVLAGYGLDGLLFPVADGKKLIGWDGSGKLENKTSESESVAQAQAAAAAALAAANAGFRFNDFASFAIAAIPAVLMFVDVAGYYAPGDGGWTSWKRMIDPPVIEKPWHVQVQDNSWWELTAETPNPRMFGAKVDKVTDDRIPLQNAVDYAQAKTKCLLLQTGTMHISDTITVADSFGFKMYGPAWQVSTEIDYGARIETASNNPVFDIAPAQFSIEGVAIIGTDSATSKGFYIHRPINSDDMDSYISRCAFANFNKSIIQEGRGVYVGENVFINCDVCGEQSWPASGVDATNPIQALPQGFRSNRWFNNRAHSCGILLTTVGSDSQYYRGLIMIGNLMDIGDQLFKGGLMQGIIAHNICEFTGVMPYAIEIERGGAGVMVEDNILNAAANDGSVSAAALTAIRVYSTATLSEASISRNKVEGWYRDGILIEANSSRTKFDGNIVRNIGHSGDPIYACLRFLNVTLTDCTILGGILHSTVATAKNLSFHSSATALSGCKVGYIAYDRSKALIGTEGTYSADTWIYRGGGLMGTSEQGYFGIGTTGPLNPLHIVDSGSSPLRLQRSGSSGGVGIVFQNTAGSFTVFGAPSGANDGAFTPGTDNVITLGSLANRWEQLFAGTATINTSDEREKENIELVRETMLDAWGDVEWCTFRYKGRKRLHVGLIAQRVRAVFEDHGLDPFELGVLCFDEWKAQKAEYQMVDVPVETKNSDGTTSLSYVRKRQMTKPAVKAGNRYGIRYEEALALEAAYVRRRLDRLEARMSVH